MPDREDIGDQVRRLRRTHELTQVALARLAGVGPRFVSELERGKPTVRLDAVAQVLAVFGLELATRPIPRPPVDEDFWDVSDMLPDDPNDLNDLNDPNDPNDPNDTAEAE